MPPTINLNDSVSVRRYKWSEAVLMTGKITAINEATKLYTVLSLDGNMTVTCSKAMLDFPGK